MYEVKEYENKYKDGLIKLWMDICVEEHGFEQWREDIEREGREFDENRYEKLLLALCEEQVIGCIAYEKVNNEVAELRRVYVYPEHRGKGIANHLYETLLNLIKEKNYKQILVRTMEGFKSGVSFYYKKNFKLEKVEGESQTFLLDL